MIYHSNGRYEDHGGFGDLEKTVRQTCATLRGHLDEFDSIVVQGVSGMSVGFPVALRLRKPIVVVRKEKEDSHSWGDELVNGPALGERALFLDDFVSSGDTRGRCRKAVEKAGAKLVGTYVYRDDQLGLHRDDPLPVRLYDGAASIPF